MLSDNITLSAATREFGIGPEKLRQLIATGKLKSTRGKATRILVSKRTCSRLAQLPTDSRQAAGGGAPSDGVPIVVLSKELEFPGNTLRHWLEWDSHPALGRKVRAGNGAFEIVRKDGVRKRFRGLLASRADVAACISSFRKPLRRLFPGNDGIWISPGIYQQNPTPNSDDKKLFFTSEYVADNYSFRTNDAIYRRKLDAQTVTWPTTGRNGKWAVTVFSEESVNALDEWREGRIGREKWIESEFVWSDGKELWYSGKYIAREKGWVDYRRWDSKERKKLGITKTKFVPDAGRGRSIRVYAACEVDKALSPASDSTAAATSAGATSAELAAPITDDDTAPAQKLKNSGGRPRDARTQQIYKFCSEERKKGHKAIVVMRTCNAEFGADAVTDARFVGIFAKRHEEYEARRRAQQNLQP